MGKSFRDRRKADFNDRSNGRYNGSYSGDCHNHYDSTIFVGLADIFISDATIAKLLLRDGAQIEHYRQAYEDGRDMVRVVLRPRFGGGYNIEDGRHRVIAAKQAGIGFIEAKLIGDIE
jgi:predicted Rdx family selenoprotein